MWLAGEAPALPEGLDALLPPWAQQLSLLTLLIVVIAAFARGYVLTRAQADRELEAERKIADIWKTNHEQSLDLLTRQTDAFQPVLEQNAAILRALEALQDRQIQAEEREERREERDRWMRDRRDRPE